MTKQGKQNGIITRIKERQTSQETTQVKMPGRMIKCEGLKETAKEG